MERETTAQRLIRQLNKDPRDYNILVGSKSIMLLPIDPEREGAADVLYLFDSERYLGGIDILVHAHADPLEMVNLTFKVNED